MGTGRIDHWLTISCGSCDATDSFAASRYQKRADAARKWERDGWRIERPDEQHKDAWWQCPACVRGESG